MKKAVLIFVLAGFFFSANAQDDLQIVDPGKMWSYLDHTNFPPWYNKTYYHKFMGDTIIDQLTYMKVWQSEDEDYQYWEPHGFIRSEENGDVYYLDKFFYGGLIYRFDVQVGDTFRIYLPYWDFRAEVLSVDSVLISPSNEYRKRIIIGDYNYPSLPEETWIEGVGSMAGVLNSGLSVHPLTGGWYDMLCEWQDGTEIFSNPDFPFCFKTTVSVPDKPENKPALTIFPMPLVGNSAIAINKQLNDGRIVITDMFGKTVKAIPASNMERVSVQRDLFKPGLYIVSLYDGDHFVDRVKMIVR